MDHITSNSQDIHDMRLRAVDGKVIREHDQNVHHGNLEVSPALNLAWKENGGYTECCKVCI